EFSRTALRTRTRIAAVLALGENVWTENFVERIEDSANAQFADLFDRDAKILPELAQEVLPRQFARGDLVELGFEIRSEIVFDIAPEETLQEGRHDSPAIVRNEAVLLHRDVIALAQLLQDRGVGGWAADAQLLQLFHQARLRIARRRFGEVLVGL